MDRKEIKEGLRSRLETYTGHLEVRSWYINHPPLEKRAIDLVYKINMMCPDFSPHEVLNKVAHSYVELCRDEIEANLETLQARADLAIRLLKSFEIAEGFKI